MGCGRRAIGGPSLRARKAWLGGLQDYIIQEKILQSRGTNVSMSKQLADPFPILCLFLPEIHWTHGGERMKP